MSGPMEGDSKDAKSGRVKERFGYFAPVGEESVFEGKKVSIKYFLADWPNEDIITFCHETILTLEDLVRRAHDRGKGPK